MNYNLAFAEAARPRQAAILHLLMRPYSIGHELQLTQEGNPILLPSEEFAKLPYRDQKRAVIRATQICCRTWLENQTQPMGRWFLFRWRIYNRNANYALAIADFQNYRGEGSTFPNIGKPDGEGRILGSPFSARLLAFVGIDNVDMPLGMAQWMYFAKAETEGMCKVLNAHESQIQHEMHELQTKGLPIDEKARLDKLRAELKSRRAQCQL